jgi:two-component system LytT family sensor kinase
MELTMLKTKISPHFLLNALNNIYYYSQQAEHNTSNAILKLSYLLQYVSYEVALKRITLERELEIMSCTKRLSITMRFEKAVQIEFDY